MNISRPADALKVLKSLVLLTLALTSPKLFAFSAELRGFIALDMIGIEKIDSEKVDGTMGLGALDLKIYATHEDFTAKIKLDLDDSNLTKAYNLYEEANVTYRASDDLKITAGKAKVPFHRMRYGVTESSYIDSGSLLGLDHSWRDVDQKILVTATYGSYKKNYFAHFTIYGNTEEFEKNRDGTLKYNFDSRFNSYELSKRPSNAFHFRDELGAATKFEYFFTRELEMSGSAIYYKSDWSEPSWGLDYGGRYRVGQHELWWESTYAVYRTHPFDRYSSFYQTELYFGLGGEYRFNPKWAALFNLETMMVNNWAWGPQAIDPRDNDGAGGTTNQKTESALYENDNYKAEIGAKYYFQKSAFMTLGFMYEKKISAKDKSETLANNDTVGFRNPNRDGRQVKLGLAFWF